MSPSVSSAISNFVASLIGIAASLCNSVLAVFQAIFALGWDIFQSTMTIVRHITLMFVELFHGVLGFVVANFLAISVVGALYWFYTTRNQRSQRSQGLFKKT